MGGPEVSQSNSNPMQRVKVYHLNEDGKWDDRGTGHVSIDYIETEELGLHVIDEEDNETLLVHHISRDDIYRKQEDTIISWRDPERSIELALSFQETTGCSYIWDQICTMQRNMHFSSLNSDTFHSLNSELRDLPAIELSTLPLILKIVTESGIADQMRLTELILKNVDFFGKLMDVFKICEDLENIDGLHMIFSIVKGIILLNSPQIFERMFGDELIMDIFGCLEYDPDAPQSQNHRKFLKEHVVFKEAIPIKDPLVLSQIHQTYRIGYMKDVVLARVLDDATVANLNSIIHSNNVTVVSLLKDDSTFIQELFSKLKSSSTSEESKKNLVYFLHEFCSLTKSLQVVQQLRLFRDLINEGIFDIIADVLRSPDKKLALTGTDILMLFLNQDSNLLRSYVVRPEGTPILSLLVKGMMEDYGDRMHCQFLDIIRTLLDSNPLSGGAQSATIMDIFFEKHLPELVDVITSSCPGPPDKNSSREVRSRRDVKPEILSSICDLLCFCILQDSSRIKCNFLHYNVTEKVLRLTRRKEKYLVVAAVRFVRVLLAVLDEYVQNCIVKNNLLKPIIDVFVANGNRYNLLNSAVLELLEHIRKGNATVLLKYIVDTFWDQLALFEHLSSVQAFKMKYEQCLESVGPKRNADLIEPRKRIDERALEKEEEEYFKEDSDEEDSASMSNTQKEQPKPHLSNGMVVSDASSSSPRTSGLVDYEDDEDEDDDNGKDCNPSPEKQTKASEKEDMESLRMKHPCKKQRVDEVSKEENISASSCSTVNSETSSTGENENSLEEAEGCERSRSCNDNNSGRRDSVDGNICDNKHGKMSGDGSESTLPSPKSSPDMAVNGS